MSNTPNSSTDQPQEIVTETPETRAKIEAALKNPDLLRVVKLLIENQGDSAFLNRIGDFAESEQRNKEALGESERTELEARKKFWGAIKSQGLNEQNCQVKNFKEFSPCITPLERAAIQPIQLSDDLFNLIEEKALIRIQRLKDCVIGDPLLMKIVPDGKVIWLQKQDGTLIEMFFVGSMDEGSEFSLRECEVRESEAPIGF